jgi:hypothetical protein
MDWKKTTIRLNRWEAGGFRITETMELTGAPFTLESTHDPDQDPATFGNLKQAQQHAVLMNDLALVNEENARLKREIQEQRDAEHFERSQLEAQLQEQAQVERDTDLEHDTPDTEIDCGEDGRGVPRSVTERLVISMHDRDATTLPSGNRYTGD